MSQELTWVLQNEARRARPMCMVAGLLTGYSGRRPRKGAQVRRLPSAATVLWGTEGAVGLAADLNLALAVPAQQLHIGVHHQFHEVHKLRFRLPTQLAFGFAVISN